MRLNARIFAGFLLLLGGFALADGPVAQPLPESATQPATEAATQPEVTPRDVLRTFVGAVYDGRPDDIPPICDAPDAASKQVVDDYTKVAAAIADLRKTLTDKFGPDEGENFPTPMTSPDDVDAMEQTITGDHAQLRSEVDVDMIRVNGQWKVDIASLLRNGVLPPDPHAALTAGVTAIRRTAADLAKGRLLTPTAVSDALRARLESLPATEPTTQPATQP